jgi:hypothetical protein
LESPVTSQPNPSARPISLFEKREELRRVLESRNFARAPKKTRFLEFVSEQTFLGNGDNLNEYLIGVEVYGRGAAFNAQEDPIVRVQAHEIRRLLKQYYEEEGKQSPIRLELPSGHYVPSFARTTIEGSADQPASPEAPAPQPTPQPVPQPTLPAALHLGLTAVLAVACLVLVFVLVARSRPDRAVAPTQATAAALPDDLAWFWRPFLPPADVPVIVIPNHPLLRAAHDGDSAQTLASGHEIPKASLPEFRDTIHYRELKRFLFVPSLTDFTSVGETLGVVRLCNMFYTVGEKCDVQQSRLVNFDEIKGENAILLGGSQAWSGRVFLNVEGFHLQSGVILNRNPQAGEKPVYRPEFDPVTNQLTRDYALVLMLPNEKKEDRVLLIYGIYTQGSQAAIEFLTNPEQMRDLRKALLALASDRKTMPPYFQALLATSVENSVPGKASLVALRVISN